MKRGIFNKMDLNREELGKRISGLIKSKKEGKTWDFKASWSRYNDKAELLHDVLCMANNCTREDSYIIIGVDEKNGFRPGENFDLKSDRNDFGFKQVDDLTDWLHNKNIKFAGSFIPDLDLITNFHIEDLDFDVDIIIVKSTFEAPYYINEPYRDKNFTEKSEMKTVGFENIEKFKLADSFDTSLKSIKVDQVESLTCHDGSTVKLKDIKSLNFHKPIEKSNSKVVRAGCIYVRREGAKSPIDRSAAPPELEALYKKKFGLTLSFMDRFELLLSKKDEWDSRPYIQGHDSWDCQSMYILHKHFPKFFIKIDFSDKQFSEREISPLPFFHEEAVEACTHGRLKLFYDKSLIKEFCVYHYQIYFGIQGLRIYFVDPLSAEVFDDLIEYTDDGECQMGEEKYIFYFFVKNDTGFNLNNILKKIPRYGISCHSIPCGVFFEETYGFARYSSSRTTSRHLEALEQWENLLKKNVIYFEDEKEKSEYKKFIEKNRKDIFHELTSTTDTKNKGEVGRFFVKHFYNWKFLRFSSSKEKWKFRSYPWLIQVNDMLFRVRDYTASCFSVRFEFFDGCSKGFYVAYFFAESEIIFRNEKDICRLSVIADSGLKYQPLGKEILSLSEFKAGKISVDDGNDSFELVFPENNKHNDFPYLYFFKDSIECKINDILLHADLTSSETSDIIKERIEKCNKIFKNCVIYFKEEEKQEFDEYLQENQDDILKKIESFYEENRRKFEDNCRKICPKEFSSGVGTMVEWGARAEKIAEIFRGWKAGKLSQ